jgi:hypothetical protein
MHRMMFSWAPSGDFLCHREQMLCDRLYFTWEIVERPQKAWPRPLVSIKPKGPCGSN